jgi:hypothetical protein
LKQKSGPFPPILHQNGRLATERKFFKKTLARSSPSGYFHFHVLCEINSGKEVDRPPLKQIRESPDFRRVSGSDEKTKKILTVGAISIILIANLTKGLRGRVKEIKSALRFFVP